jgi:hypothetical protein
VNFNKLVKKISFETFAEVIAVSPRKVRESLFAHYGVKSKSRSLLLSIKEKKEERIKNLHAILQNITTAKEQEFLKELFRNWLFHKRPLLKTTLDYLGIENNDGLVEFDTDFFKDLDEQKVSDLITRLRRDFPDEAILIYLTFVEVPFLDKYF